MFNIFIFICFVHIKCKYCCSRASLRQQEFIILITAWKAKVGDLIELWEYLRDALNLAKAKTSLSCYRGLCKVEFVEELRTFQGYILWIEVNR